MAYTVFHRRWWISNNEWPDGREPHIGRKHTIRKDVKTEPEARELCLQWDSEHKPGKLSDKAEYEEQ